MKQSHWWTVTEKTLVTKADNLPRTLLRDINGLQGDDYRNFRRATVRFVRSEDLLKLDYALRCFLEPDFPYWAYKLAAEYVEGYGLQSGSGIVAESVPRLLEVAEFWCQYYFTRSLSEKFPDEGDRWVRPNPWEFSDADWGFVKPATPKIVKLAIKLNIARVTL